MKTFLTEYLAVNEAGRVCLLGGELFAESWQGAREKAAELGHTVIGIFVEEIEAPEMQGLCEEIQRRRDNQWNR